jgi:hypothetical protein
MVSIRIVRWNPPKEAVLRRTESIIPNPEEQAGVILQKLQAELAGCGCGCMGPDDLIRYLALLGVEVVIESSLHVHERS